MSGGRYISIIHDFTQGIGQVCLDMINNEWTLEFTLNYLSATSSYYKISYGLVSLSFSYHHHHHTREMHISSKHPHHPTQRILIALFHNHESNPSQMSTLDIDASALEPNHIAMSCRRKGCLVKISQKRASRNRCRKNTILMQNAGRFRNTDFFGVLFWFFFSVVIAIVMQTSCLASVPSRPP